MHVPSGRYEKRTARAVTVGLLRLDESQPNKRAVTENVSPRGVRIVTDWNYAPGKHLLVTAPEEGVKSLARVVYCQRVESTKFAVGLQLVVRVEEWGNPASRESLPIEKSQYGNPLRRGKQRICQKRHNAENFCVTVTIASASFRAKFGLSTVIS
jgi:hypothetical protein